MIKIFTDGGSRGNPGMAACAYVVFNGNQKITEGSKYLGHTTNNVAEYQGVLLALNDYLEKQKADIDIHFFLDSELVVKQLNGIYKIKDEKMKDLNFEIQKKIKELKVKITFSHVPREENKRADFLVNKELDNSSVM